MPRSVGLMLPTALAEAGCWAMSLWVTSGGVLGHSSFLAVVSWDGRRRPSPVPLLCISTPHPVLSFFLSHFFAPPISYPASPHLWCPLTTRCPQV